MAFVQSKSIASSTLQGAARMACYLVAALLPLWVFRYKIPAIGMRPVHLSVLAVYLIGCVVALRYGFLFKNVLPYLGFVLWNIIVYLAAPSSYDLSFMLQLAGAFLFFFLLQRLVYEYSLYATMVRILVFVTAAISLILIVEHLFVFKSLMLTSSLITFTPHYSPTKNGLGLFLALVFPFAYALCASRKNLLHAVLPAIIAFGIVYTMSRMALGAMLLSMLLFVVVSRDRKRFVVQGLALVAVLAVVTTLAGFGPSNYVKRYAAMKQLYYNDGQVIPPRQWTGSFTGAKSSRFVIASRAVKGWLEKPLLGHGLGSFKRNRVYSSERHLKGVDPHSDYFKILYELGAIGIMLYIVMMILTVGRLWKFRHNDSMNDKWLIEGQLVCVLTVFASAMFICVYQSILFWYVMAGSLAVIVLHDRCNMQGGEAI